MPDNPPLLKLLEQLINQAVQAQPPHPKMALQSLQLNPNGAVLFLEVQQMTPLLNGPYTVALQVKNTDPTCTLCTLELPGKTTTEGILKLGAKMAGGLLNEALHHYFGPGISLTKDQIRLEHEPLIQHFFSQK